ncbi:MAG TPA: hydrogenase expression protein HypE [Rhodospirillaceae bacterium]|nr:MAG: hydrogenase expression protein HypE [Alphaproteobacteria bacterium GWF2_58_20]HAU29768.1 hydrogenase expression protein HypE [Rhodospirillaceae bacterium]
MTSLKDILAKGKEVQTGRVFPRAVFGAENHDLPETMAQGELDLLGLWGDDGCVHAAMFDRRDRMTGIVTIEAAKGHFPSFGLHFPAAVRMERTITDLFGLVPDGAQDTRRWLDHGQWNVSTPLGQQISAPPCETYAFLPVEGESLHRVLVGPVHAGIIEPGYFRFHASGETIVRLEERLGYVHKGIEALLQGADVETGAKLVARVSGDSTVAYSTAYARAIETALGIDLPPRAHFLRGIMTELERVANHMGDIGAICNDGAFAMMLAECSVLREKVARTAFECFGHRMMMDKVVPGGVATNLDASGISCLRTLVAEITPEFASLMELYDSEASILDRTETTGILSPELAAAFAAPGHVGRASGRNFDSRRDCPHEPYSMLPAFDIPVLKAGDVDARLRIRALEIPKSLGLIIRMLDHLPDGAPFRSMNAATGQICEGLGITESFRGNVLVWLRLSAEGTIERCHPHDPSWIQWPLLEDVIRGNIIADFPLCNKSFNCSYSGHDL